MLSLNKIDFSDINNKNILVLGRDYDTNTKIINKITEKYNIIYNIDFNNYNQRNIIIDYIEHVFKNIITQKGKKVLIINNLQKDINKSDNVEEISRVLNNILPIIMSKDNDFELTTVMISTNYDFNYDIKKCISVLLDNIILLNTYFYIDNYVNNILNLDIDENMFEEIVDKYIKNNKAIIFENTGNIHYSNLPLL